MPVGRLLRWVLGWVAAVSAAHLTLNVDWSSALNDWRSRDQRKFNVAYIPVT